MSVASPSRPTAVCWPRSDDATVRIWETAPGKEKAILKGHTFPVGCVAFSPDGKTLAVARYEHDMQLRDAATGEVLAVLEDTQFPPLVAFSPDGKFLAAGGADGRVKLWDLPAAK
jgi:WD40 repeat protein